ncbi:sterol desaturase family protein [Providencia alcalifaciens]|uniref:sterol desaturase family protein n=1 Tax=Providencia alcalifaciens TaxID=126385 RepID=UPI001CE04DC2|nr:sterol desaturase family protein [Providencia alcalifaciens]UBX49003.1 sterol desaturase family protein [Providencia alcalifaciens]
MNWNLTRTQYMADFIVVPIYVILAFTVALFRENAQLSWLIYFILGWCIWTLMEYIIHRYGFHFYYKRDHARHHVKPRAWIGTTPLVSTSLLAIIWGLCAILSNSIGLGSIIFIGFCFGYYSYIGIHYLIHHSKLAIINPLRHHHELHHRNPRINYGVSVRFWDYIFRTKA